MSRPKATHCKNGHPMTPDNLYYKLRKHAVDKAGRPYLNRECRVCGRAARRRLHAQAVLQ